MNSIRSSDPIADLEKQIDAVEQQIKDAERHLQDATDKDDKEYWRVEEMQLRDKKKQLKDVKMIRLQAKTQGMFSLSASPLIGVAFKDPSFCLR